MKLLLSTEPVYYRVDGKRFSHSTMPFVYCYTQASLTQHTAPPDKHPGPRGHGSQVIVTSIMSFVPHGILVVLSPCLVDQEAEAWRSSCRARDGDAPEPWEL